MFYTAVWCQTNEDDFKKNIPFEALAESIKRYNSKVPFYVVFLEGIDKVSEKYLSRLNEYGFNVINYCTEFQDIVKRYPNLDRFYSRYERNCLLRWIAFYNIHKNNPGKPQFWHLDSDIVLHTSLNDLARDTSGKTFMLQGCPVLLTVSNHEWFSIYEKELNELDSNIIEYSNEAFQVKDECKQRDIQLANESLYRNPIGSDQDLLEYLVSSGKIPQDTSDTIFNSNYYFIQNALAIKMWHQPQTSSKSNFTLGDNLQIKIIDKSVAFIHYQSTFTNYINTCLFLRRMRVPTALIKPIIKFKITEADFKTTFIFRVIGKLLNVYSKRNRADVIKEAMTIRGNDGIPQIVDILNLLLKLS
ncbi:hypothetical protein ACFQ21_15220 [Ohtaekwangia kribbensis]|jgi:hypothetical protein|uniref:Nucleotide-diphospho-sugar transferase n=1 Tax=Ohtaekwangia kribbensis TaxID=688913 RepID=A0ABW3K357_9BACT